jgi:hypothetical protein
MAEETKTVTFDLNLQGISYVTPKVAFGRSEDRLILSLRGPMVDLTASDAEALGTHLIAAAEGIRRNPDGGTDD